jgi:hypothetical protein
VQLKTKKGVLILFDKRSLPIRSKSHVLEEESRIAVKNILPSEWVIQDIFVDYGADFYVEIYKNSKPTGYEFSIQLKASEKSGKNLTVDMPVKTINYLRQRPIPSMIVGYDANRKKLYYCWLEEFLISREYGKKVEFPQKTVSVTFSDNSSFDKKSIQKIIDYFVSSGVPPASAQELLRALPESNAEERYNILKELRFIRTEKGILYLLSHLTLDLMLEDLSPDEKDREVFGANMSAFLEVCLRSPSLPSTMLFFGILADLASEKKHNYKQMTQRLFDRTLPKFLAMDPETIAKQAHKLFGYSAEIVIADMVKKISNSDLKKLGNALLPYFKNLRLIEANSPMAPDYYAALYTIHVVDNQIVYLRDNEIFLLSVILKRIEEKKPSIDERNAFFLIDGLADVYGFNRKMEFKKGEESERILSQTMAFKKVRLFLGIADSNKQKQLKERIEVVKYLASDMDMHHRMFWYGCALDYFGISSYARELLHGGR